MGLITCVLQGVAFPLKKFCSLLFKAKRSPASKKSIEEQDPLSLLQRVCIYMEMITLGLFGQLREIRRYMGFEKRGLSEKEREGYAPLFDNYASFFISNILQRAVICLNHPICGVPGSEINIKERTTPDHGWTIRFTGRVRKLINLASYNYLGFAEASGPCVDKVADDVDTYGLASSSPKSELGTSALIEELESLTARFLGVESSMVFGMGFATNSMNIPALVGKNCLVLSDQLNHASIVHGCCLSGATCKTFKHADMVDLEEKLRSNIVQGNKYNRPWKKILIVVEGIYSMEGTIINLPKLIELKKKYKVYLYLDEAHSIGAIGPHGRGVTDFWGCDPNDVDIMMGTFTKSFGSAGGYLAGSKKLIENLKLSSHSHYYACSMSPPVASQIISSMKIIMGEDGTNDGISRIKQIAENARYFRSKLKAMGFKLICAPESPVVIVMLYQFSKVLIHRAFEKKGIAVVVVGFPVVPLGAARIRICLSAGHTKEMLDEVLEAFDTLGDWMGAKYLKAQKK